MTTADLPVIIGETRFLQAVAETIWGTVPSSPTWIDIPVTDCTIMNKPKRRSGQARVGQYQQRYGSNSSIAPSGNIVTPLFGPHPTGLSMPLAQYMLEWGFLDQEVKFPRSKSLQYEYAAHEDDKGFSGVRVSQATVAGSESGIVLTLDCMGATTTNFTGSAVPPDNRNKLVEFLFEDCVFSIGGTPVPISAFSWSVQRSLTPIYMNSHTPTSMPKTTWKETLTVTPLKADATYDALRDALGMTEMTGTLVMKGLHNGTGTVATNWAVVTVSYARLSLIDSGESGGIGALMNPLTFDVLKPDTSTNASVMAWTETA